MAVSSTPHLRQQEASVYPINANSSACADAASVTAGQFDVTGAAGLVVDLTGSPTATLTDGNGNSMPIVLEKSDRDLTMTGSPLPLYVGGAITVAANQTPGVYSASFDVTAEYQ